MKARLLMLPLFLSMSCSAHVEETRILKTSAFALLLNYLRFSESPINVNTKPKNIFSVLFFGNLIVV